MGGHRSHCGKESHEPGRKWWAVLRMLAAVRAHTPGAGRMRTQRAELKLFFLCFISLLLFVTNLYVERMLCHHIQNPPARHQTDRGVAVRERDGNDSVLIQVRLEVLD